MVVKTFARGVLSTRFKRYKTMVILTANGGLNFCQGYTENLIQDIQDNGDSVYNWWLKLLLGVY